MANSAFSLPAVIAVIDETTGASDAEKLIKTSAAGDLDISFFATFLGTANTFSAEQTIESTAPRSVIVNGSHATTTGIGINRPGTTGDCKLTFGDAASTSVGAISYSHDTDTLTIDVGGSTELTLTSTGINDTPLGATTPSTVAATTLSITEGEIVSGTYTPTLTNVANLDGSTAFVCQYMRVGSVVTVSGQVNMDPTTTSTTTTLGISLPIASALAAQRQLAGVATPSSGASQSAAIYADTANARAELTWVTTSTVNRSYFFQFTYLIV